VAVLLTYRLPDVFAYRVENHVFANFTVIVGPQRRNA